MCFFAFPLSATSDGAKSEAPVDTSEQHPIITIIIIIIITFKSSFLLYDSIKSSFLLIVSPVFVLLFYYYHYFHRKNITIKILLLLLLLPLKLSLPSNHYHHYHYYYYHHYFGWLSTAWALARISCAISCSTSVPRFEATMSNAGRWMGDIQWVDFSWENLKRKPSIFLWNMGLFL